MSAIEQAKRLFRAFQKREPRPREIICLEMPGKEVVALEVGTLISLGYRKAGNGEFYKHEFETPRAKVYVTAGGRQILIVGGGYELTHRGFER